MNEICLMFKVALPINMDILAQIYEFLIKSNAEPSNSGIFANNDKLYLLYRHPEGKFTISCNLLREKSAFFKKIQFLTNITSIKDILIRV